MEKKLHLWLKCARSKRFSKIYNKVGTEVFGNSRVKGILNCSETTASNYLKRMSLELQVIVPVDGAGKGKYKFQI